MGVATNGLARLAILNCMSGRSGSPVARSATPVAAYERPLRAPDADQGSWGAVHILELATSLGPRSRPIRDRLICGGSHPRWAASGFRDLPAEGLEGDCVGLGPAPTAGVQAVDRGHLVGGQLEVEHVDVLCDASGLGGLRNDRASVLQTPTQHHLGDSLAVGLGDVCDERVVERAAVAAVAVEGDAADR